MPRRRRRARRFSMPEVSLTPLIDTALTLLVIFMVTTPMIQHNVKVELPPGNSKEVGTEQEYVVTLNKDKQIFFNSFPVKEGTLVETVQSSLKGHEEMPLYVRADEVVSYGEVMQVVNQLKEAGVRYVALSTRAIAGK